MAKNDNLQDFLTDVANAIRNKKGTSNLINPQNFSSEIESIESSSFNVELFYGFWQLKKDNQTYVLKVYDTGKLDYEIYTSSPTKYTDINYTIINDTIEFQFVSGGSSDNIEITVKKFKYENDTLIDINTNDIYNHILFSDGTLSVTENGSYGSTDSNGFNMVDVNVQGGDYDIDVVYNDDGTQSLYIVDSDSSIDRNATIKGLIDRTATTINIPSGVKSIARWAFSGCTGLTSVTIPDSVTSIGSFAFQFCNVLTKVTMPSSVTSIEREAFYYCRGLTEVTIPDGVTSIENQAFYGCSSLTRVTIGSGVTSIRGGAFRDCSSLTSITIPSSVTSIDGATFYNCSKLTEMTILATTPPTLGSTGAISSATTTIYIPAGTLEAYSTATNWSNFASKFVELEV